MFARTEVAACIVAAALIAPGIAAGASKSSLSASRGGGSAVYARVESSLASSGPAVDVYSEPDPTSTVCKARKNGKTTTTKLSKTAENALASATGPNGEILKKIVARSGSETPKGTVKFNKSQGVRTSSSFGGSLRAAIVSHGAGSTARLAVLLAVIVAISAAVGVAAVRKQRM